MQEQSMHEVISHMSFFYFFIHVAVAWNACKVAVRNTDEQKWHSWDQQSGNKAQRADKKDTFSDLQKFHF